MSRRRLYFPYAPAGNRDITAAKYGAAAFLPPFLIGTGIFYMQAAGKPPPHTGLIRFRAVGGRREAVWGGGFLTAV